MPRNARVVAPGLPYHITQRGTNRQRVFFTAGDRSLYLSLIRENQAHAGVRILAYCLMTNHVHFVVIPEREDSLAVLFGRANGRYSQAINIRKGRSGHLWQDRFHSCALSESHLEIALRYVEDNPCRAGMAARLANIAGRAPRRICSASRIEAMFWTWGFGSEPVGRKPGRECTQAGGCGPDRGASKMHLFREAVRRRVLCLRNGGAVPSQMASRGAGSDGQNREKCVK